MPKSGQHKHDSNDQRVSKGPNDPKESMVITTGSYKKPETYRKQAFAHEDPYKQPPQRPFDPRNDDIRESPSIENSPRARDSSIRSGRSGSDSNASRRTRGH